MEDNHLSNPPPENQVDDLLESFQTSLSDNFQTTQVAKHICSYILANLE